MEPEQAQKIAVMAGAAAVLAALATGRLPRWLRITLRPASRLWPARPVFSARQGLRPLIARRLQRLWGVARFAIQMLGSDFIVWQDLPAFRQLVLSPGERPASTPYDGNTVLAVLFAMQVAYWYRLLRVAIPFRGPSLALSHLFLFLGRLNFIFGSALFSIVLFRHVPELGPGGDTLLMARRGVVLVISLFALFCFTLELERLGVALGEAPQT